MRKYIMFFLLYAFVSISIVYPNEHNKDKISIKFFSTYDEAIKYMAISDSINKDTIKKNKIKNTKSMAKYTKQKFNNFKFKTSCDTFNADIIDDDKRDIDLYTFSDGKRIKYKVSDDGRFIFVTLVSFSLEDIKDVKLQDKKRFLIKVK